MGLESLYRPKDLDSIFGNRGIVEAFRAISNRTSDYPHAVLLIGPTGSGKTTIARIYANILKCHENDIIEINNANNRGIDTARNIQTEMRYLPFDGNVRVYIIDEVGAATKDFQTAMLKALEEPPSHVYFILCTTDPGNLLPALKNRCQIFETQYLTKKETTKLLNKVLDLEKVDLPQEIISEIAEISNGCARQALVILDQVIDIPEIDDIKKALIDLRVDESTMKELFKALLNKEPWRITRQILSSIDLTNPEKVRRDILNYCSAVLLNCDDHPQAAYILNVFKENTYNTGRAGIVDMCYNATL